MSSKTDHAASSADGRLMGGAPTAPLPDRPLPTRLLGNFLVLAGGETLSKGLTMLAFAYLARMLGPAEFGYLEFALAVVVFLALLVDGGLSPYAAREVAKQPRTVTALLPHVTLIRLALGSVACVLLIGFVGLLDRPWPAQRVLLLYGLTLLALPFSLAWAFQGRDRMGYVAAGSTLRWMLFAGGVFLYVRTPNDTWIVPLVETAAIVAAGCFYVAAFRRQFGAWTRRFDMHRGLTMLREAFPIGASELVWGLRMSSGTVLLGLLVGGTEVGWFAGAHRIVVALHTFVWLYFFNVLPSLARTTVRPREELHALMRRSLRDTAWATVFAALVATILAEPIVTLLYGAPFAGAAPVLRALIWLAPAAMISGHFRYVLIGYGQQHWELLASASGAAVALGLGIPLVLSFGMLGAAWALVASEVVIGVLASLFVRRTITPIPFVTTVGKALLVGAALTAALSYSASAAGSVTGLAVLAAYCLSAVGLECRSGRRRHDAHGARP